MPRTKRPHKRETDGSQTVISLRPVRFINYADKDDGAETEYDPHLHRKLVAPLDVGETFVHMIKGSIGTGILAMPRAFYNCGLINGYISTILMGIISTYCIHILIRSQYILCKRLKVPVLTYGESMKEALKAGPQGLRRFANMSIYLVDVFIIMQQTGICCSYVLFVALNVKAIGDKFSTSKSCLLVYVMYILMPFILISCIRTLKTLAPFSSQALFLIFISLGIFLYYFLRDVPNIGERSVYGTVHNYPLFVGTTLFSLDSIAVVTLLENNMQDPKRFRAAFGVLNVSMMFTTFIHASIGFLGYWKFGDDTADSITLNISLGEVLAEIIIIAYSLGIFLSYGLQSYVAVVILLDTYVIKYFQRSRCKRCWEYVLRACSVVLIFFFAIAIPFLALFISFCGTFFHTALGFAFPALIEICVLYPDGLGRGNYILIKDLLLIAFGLAGLLSGTYSSAFEIIKAFRSKNVFRDD